MKKFLSLFLAIVMLMACASLFVACDSSDDSKETNGTTDGTTDGTTAGTTGKKIKVGFIFLHDENSTYDNNFLQAAQQACEEMGVDIVVKKNIPESAACKEAADDLVAQGCSVIFADSFGHEDYMIEAAREHTDVQFCHATGTKAHTENLSNYHNAFASIYEGRYLAGIAAGMKLVEMYGDDDGNVSNENAVMGYVGAFTYAEVMSGYTSFYLGAKSVCPNVTMKVTFTGSWYDEAKEKLAAEKLISEGCKLISQHADSMGAPKACEAAGIPNVSYNGSTKEACPTTFIVSSRIDWTPYMKYMIEQVQKGEAIETDWTGTLSTGSVVLTEINDAAAAAGTKEAIETAEKALREGTLHVFDINTFTVKGEKLTSYMADVNTDDAFTPDTEVIKDGYFDESNDSDKRSAPYFDVRIDGITLLDEAY